MNDSGERDKWVAGALPSRRIQRRRLPVLQPNSVLVERLLRANKKSLVGRPLTTALREMTGERSALPRKALRYSSIAAGACLLAATVAGLPLIIAGAGFAAVVAGVLISWRRKSPSACLGFAGELRDDAASLDAYLDKVSPNLPQAALESLARIKETLARVLATLATDGDSAADMPAEEKFFAREMVTRYLPDACRHYIEAAEAAGGNAVLNDGRSADESLHRQLDVLHSRLEKALAIIAAGKAQKLANHEAFIGTKRS